MDYKVLVYKVDNPVQSSLSSSLVLTSIQGSFSWSTLRSWVHNNTDVILSKRRELEKATAIWARVIDKEVLEL